MGAVRDLAEELWSGQKTTHALQPVTTLLGLEPFGDGLAFLSSFANVVLLDTSEGLVLIDTGSFFLAGNNHANVREWSQSPAKLAIYTHGHVDHAFGLEPFEAEARAEVIAHELVKDRFDRYQLTAGYNESINARQFGAAAWPKGYRYPDTTYRTSLTREIAGEKLELFHARGETDDHTWVWLPERKVLCTGDLFIWASPNCGNPQKVQRFPREWARALRSMAALGPETLFPGHGMPILGKDRVEQALTETAELLETLVDQTLALMNDGARLDRVLAEVRAPDHLLERPYLRPVYDEPEFIVRNLWRLYGGWYDGNPARLKPPRDADVARELAALSGGADKLAARAKELSAAGDHALACHLAELAAQADPATRGIRSDVYLARADSETSLMARAVYRAAADDK
ncbi:MAG: MBL fold metallo-hydrolase [Myxococcales bacterium]|nr:MBL fold metallo-hydrolase [Myxococcales bacterium]